MPAIAFLTGLLLVFVGAWMIYPAAAVFGTGALLVTVAVLAELGARRERRQAELRAAAGADE